MISVDWKEYASRVHYRSRVGRAWRTDDLITLCHKSDVSILQATHGGSRISRLLLISFTAYS